MGVPVDPRLRGALQRPGLEVATCDDPFAVLAVLTSAHLGGAGAKILLLIEPQRLAYVIDLLDMAPRYVPEMAIWLFDPTRQPVLRSARIADVLAAIGVTKAAVKAEPVAPRARSAQAIAPDQEGGPSAPVAWTGPWVSASTQKWSEPVGGLRLTGEGTLPERGGVREDEVDAFAAGAQGAGAGAPAPAQPPRSSPRVLTDEELAMLLGDGPASGSVSGGRKP